MFVIDNETREKLIERSYAEVKEVARQLQAIGRQMQNRADEAADVLGGTETFDVTDEEDWARSAQRQLLEYNAMVSRLFEDHFACIYLLAHLTAVIPNAERSTENDLAVLRWRDFQRYFCESQGRMPESVADLVERAGRGDSEARRVLAMLAPDRLPLEVTGKTSERGFYLSTKPVAVATR